MRPRWTQNCSWSERRRTPAKTAFSPGSWFAYQVSTTGYARGNRFCRTDWRPAREFHALSGKPASNLILCGDRPPRRACGPDRRCGLHRAPMLRPRCAPNNGRDGVHRRAGWRSPGRTRRPSARRLGIAKSIVSRRLFRLESELGVQLLARTTRGAALTQTGTAFREHAARVCAEMDSARETILPAGELRGRPRLAAPLSFGVTHLAPVLAELARRNPLLQVHVTYSDSFIDLVGEGFDASVRVGYLTDSNLIVRRIGPVYGQLVASPGYLEANGAPETPADLVNHEALMQGTKRPSSIRADASSLTPRRRWRPRPRRELVSPIRQILSSKTTSPQVNSCRS